MRAIYSQEGGVLYSYRIALALKTLLEANGVTIMENFEAKALNEETGEVTSSSNIKIQADNLIVTVGAWVRQFLSHQTKALMPRQTYATFLKPPTQFEETWQKAPPFVDVGNHVDGYVLPPGNGCDLKFGSGLTRAMFDPEKLTQNVTMDEAEFLRNAFGKAFVDIEHYEILRSRRCAYTFTQDDRFWANESGKTIVLSACSGHGYKFGALLGLKLADSLLRSDFEYFVTWVAGK